MPSETRPGRAAELRQQTVEFFECIFAGFRPRELADTVCQFTIQGDGGDSAAFHLLAGRDDLLYREGTHPAPGATVVMPQSTMNRLMGWSRETRVDLGDPLTAPAVRLEGDLTLATKIGSLITAPRPEQIQRYEDAAALDRSLGSRAIPRVHGPTEEQVVELLGSGQPLVATGCLEHWECLGWNLDEMRDRFGAIDFAASGKDPERRITLREFIDGAHSGQDSYSAGFPAPEEMTPFFPMPFFEGSLGKTNLWLGTRARGAELTYLHRDPSYILHAQILGAKDWLLFSPSQAELLYPYRSFSGFQRCWVDPKNPDLAKHPLFERARPQRITVGPGEVLMMPPGWFHSVYVNQAPLLSVTAGISRQREAELFRPRPEGAGSGARASSIRESRASEPRAEPARLAPGTPKAASFPALAELIAPSDVGRFLADHWETKPLRISRSEPERFASLVSFEDVDRALTTLDLHPPQLRVARDGTHVDPGEITTAEGRFDPHRVYRLFEQGCTIVLSELNFVLPRLARFCRRLEAELTHPFQTNIYMTPPGAQGFAPHYDAHDVFVLQVAGTKTWREYRTPVPLPLKNQGWVRDEHDPGEPVASHPLAPGDTLYLPRGLMHDARSGDGISLHVTLSLSGITWADVMVQALGQLCQSRPEYRRAVPYGFARPDFDVSELRPTLRSLLDGLHDALDLESALGAVADDFVATRYPLLKGHLEELCAVAEVTPDTVVERRPDLVYRFESDDAHFALLVHGMRVPLPKPVEGMVRFALATPVFRPRDLPGPLGPKSQVTVVQRLIREGVLLQRGTGSTRGVEGAVEGKAAYGIAGSSGGLSSG